jgi:hypothetical protein
MLCRRLPWSWAGERAFFPMRQGGCKKQSYQLGWLLQGTERSPPTWQEAEAMAKTHSKWLWSRAPCLRIQTHRRVELLPQQLYSCPTRTKRLDIPFVKESDIKPERDLLCQRRFGGMGWLERVSSHKSVLCLWNSLLPPFSHHTFKQRLAMIVSWPFFFLLLSFREDSFLSPLPVVSDSGTPPEAMSPNHPFWRALGLLGQGQGKGLLQYRG